MCTYHIEIILKKQKDINKSIIRYDENKYKNRMFLSLYGFLINLA